MSKDAVHRRPHAVSLLSAVVFVSAFAINSDALALRAKSNLGPSIAVIADHTYLIHVGHDSDHIWEARGSNDWPTGWTKDRVHDSDRRSWAFSKDSADTVVHGDRLYLFYRGHNNDRLWFTRKRVRLDTSVTPRRLEEGAWDTPQNIPGADTLASPAVAIHRWTTRDPSLNAVFTDNEGRIQVRYARPWANPDHISWHEVPRPLPAHIRTSHPPEAISFEDKLYIFYFHGSHVFVVRGDDNLAHSPGWTTPRRISPVVSLNRTPTVFQKGSALYMLFAAYGNHYLWVAKSTDGLNWEELGFIPHVVTDQRPSVARDGTHLKLAFRPLFSNELAFGLLTIDDSNAPTTPGHQWQTSRSERHLKPRLVSDLLLSRRWPNGVVPFKFASELGIPHKDAADYELLKTKARAALFGSTSDPSLTDCTAASPCIGWAGAETIRFVECPEDVAHCGDYKYYVFIRISDYNDGTCKYPNSTKRKRGFADLKSAELRDSYQDDTDDPCEDDAVFCEDDTDLLRTRDCRKGRCDWESGETCVFDVWLRITGPHVRYMWKSGHEFGHMLGFNHEQFRPDRDGYIDTTSCSRLNLEWNDSVHLLTDAHFMGSYDVRSIMHYPNAFDGSVPVNDDTYVDRCWTSKPGAPIGGERNHDVPTARDLAKLQLMYGVRGDWLLDSDWCIYGGREIHVGDFNGDGRDDLLCHSARTGVHATGRRWLDYSNNDGHFNGTNWDSGSHQYCWGSSRTLLVGDFKGDGNDDALCFNSERGTLTIDYTNDAGELNGQDWPDSGTQAWACDEPSSQAYVGKFNSDDRDDLLCHNRRTGSRWIDWANDNGHFQGPDWSSATVGTHNWCSGATERVIIGNFNGDSRDDALCHDTSSGHRKIDYASRDGDLKGTNWSSLAEGAAAFCKGADETLYAADFNGDRSDDLLCHDRRTGMIAVDIAKPELGPEQGSGLLGEDFYRDLAFCNARDAQLVIGSFDRGNSRDDLLCHNRETGHKAVLYAKQNGTFQIPAGY